MNYSELKTRQSAELSEFPMFFAFDEKQFERGMRKLGVTETDTLASIPGSGFIRKRESDAFKALFTRFHAEIEDAMQDREFLVDAIAYELTNYEYGYTLDPEPALRALGITLDSDKNKEFFALARNRVLQ